MKHEPPPVTIATGEGERTLLLPDMFAFFLLCTDYNNNRYSMALTGKEIYSSN